MREPTTVVNLAKHAGAWLIVGALVYVLCVISPAWPAMVVGIVGGFLFAVAEADELATWWRSRRHTSRALRFADERRQRA
jgi:hypothetical protein